MTWRRDKLPELVRAMAGRPRHEALRGHVTELLREGFGAPYDEIAHEVYLLDKSGRIDTMWGATVIELKSDLRREQADVEARMPDYLADAARRSRSHRPVTGIATDGAVFIAYQLVEGRLTELKRYATNAQRPGELVGWLELLLPEARIVAQTFGRLLAKITDLQPHGQRDKRDFDNLVWTLPIPEYDDAETLHRDLATVAGRAEAVAASVQLTDSQHFTAKRRAIREALAEDGVSAEIEAMVDALLSH